jgi:hypothetical protein
MKETIKIKRKKLHNRLLTTTPNLTKMINKNTYSIPYDILFLSDYYSKVFQSVENDGKCSCELVFCYSSPVGTIAALHVLRSTFNLLN